MKRGFTLVELLIVLTVLLMLIGVVVMTLNPVGIMNKARDARRKKDINRIKVAFEEYYNDTGCYPKEAVVTDLMTKTNCGSKIFSPWLASWPCDPTGVPYQVVIDDYRNLPETCPKWFKILTKLENTTDWQVPAEWKIYAQESIPFPLGRGSDSSTANFGVSSTNVIWYDYRLDPVCGYYGGCYYKPDANSCNAIGAGCVGPNCYVGLCEASCRTMCCGSRCD